MSKEAAVAPVPAHAVPAHAAPAVETPAAPLGGITPQEVVLPTDYASREAVIQDVSDWDAQGEAFIDFLNTNATPNGDTGFQPSSQEGALTGQPMGQPMDAAGQQTAAGQTASVASQAAQDAQTLAGQAQAGQAQAGQVQAAPAETLETLRSQVTELQQVKTFMESQDYKDARAVMDEFRKDPVEFYEKYLPQSLAVVQNRQAVASMKPEDYVRASTDRPLPPEENETAPDLEVTRCSWHFPLYCCICVTGCTPSFLFWGRFGLTPT